MNLFVPYYGSVCPKHIILICIHLWPYLFHILGENNIMIEVQYKDDFVIKLLPYFDVILVYNLDPTTLYVS